MISCAALRAKIWFPSAALRAIFKKGFPLQPGLGLYLSFEPNAPDEKTFAFKKLTDSGLSGIVEVLQNLYFKKFAKAKMSVTFAPRRREKTFIDLSGF